MASGGTEILDYERYSQHREHFTRAVLELAPGHGNGRLCVLGAGKCHDLELDQLAGAFAELHLVDIDSSAVAAAVSRHAGATRAKLRPHAPVDLALLSAKRAAKWQRKPPAASELDAAAAGALQDVRRRLPGPFDVVVSACMITQLGFALTEALGQSHPLLGPLRLTTARLHLQTLLELTTPGGKSLFVSDLASSTHYPLDGMPPETDLAPVMQDVLTKRVFYHLAHPDMVRDLCAELDPEAQQRQLPPWLWTGPLERTYLVYGLVLQRG